VIQSRHLRFLKNIASQCPKARSLDVFRGVRYPLFAFRLGSQSKRPVQGLPHVFEKVGNLLQVPCTCRSASGRGRSAAGSISACISIRTPSTTLSSAIALRCFRHNLALPETGSPREDSGQFASQRMPSDLDVSGPIYPGMRSVERSRTPACYKSLVIGYQNRAGGRRVREDQHIHACPSSGCLPRIGRAGGHKPASPPGPTTINPAATALPPLPRQGR
jgi:hypothetical protein